MATTTLEKTRKFKETLKSLETMGDGLGLGLDDGIKETVALLMELGFPTSSSCEGHVDHGTPAPWVMFEAPVRPKWEYIDQENVFANVAKKHNLTLEAVVHCDDFEVWCEAINEAEKNGTTPEFTEWCIKNESIANDVQKIVNKFYSKNNRFELTDKNTLIQVIYWRDFVRLCNGKLYYDRQMNGEKTWKAEEIPKIETDLKKCQKEFKEFTEFLRGVYFSKND